MKRIFFFLVSAVVLCAIGTWAAERVVIAEADASGVQRVNVVGGDYYFDPGRIVVKVNVPVELTVKKQAGMVPHDIAMNSPEAGMDFKETLSDKPKAIRFTPTKPGVYPVYCTKKLLFFKSHRERGMEGVIEVRE